MLARLFATAEPWSLLPLRIALGGIFIVHGSQKLFVFGFPGVAKYLIARGFHPAMFWAIVLILVELLGGIAILVGFMTRWAVALITIEMIVAIYRVVWRTGFFVPGAGVEFNIALIAASLTLLLAGAKKPSVDQGLSKEL